MSIEQKIWDTAEVYVKQRFHETTPINVKILSRDAFVDGAKWMDELKDLELAIVLRMLSKSIFKLQHLGAKKISEELLEEARSFGINIIIKSDPTDSYN